MMTDYLILLLVDLLTISCCMDTGCYQRPCCPDVCSSHGCHPRYQPPSPPPYCQVSAGCGSHMGFQGICHPPHHGGSDFGMPGYVRNDHIQSKRRHNPQNSADCSEDDNGEVKITSRSLRNHTSTYKNGSNGKKGSRAWMIYTIVILVVILAFILYFKYSLQD